MRPALLRRSWTTGFAGMLLAALLVGAAPSVGVIVNNTPLDGTQAATQESNLGDLATDSMRGVANNQADIAILPASELRDTVIPAGKIDTGQLVGGLRAESDDGDTVVLLHLSGAQVKKALDHGLSRLPAPFAGFLQVSGIHVTYQNSSGGPTVSSVTLNSSGDTISDTHNYTVATSRLLAGGALGYFEIWNKNDIASDTGTPLAKAVADYATAHQPLDYHVEGRITAR